MVWLVEQWNPRPVSGDVPDHGNPVWIGVCSCGEPTGLVAICQHEPKPDNLRPGHEGHTTSVAQLGLDHRGLSPEAREQLHRAWARTT